MICKSCGAVVADNSKFCTICGSKIEMEEIISEPVIKAENVQTDSKSVHEERKEPIRERTDICIKCGSTLKPGAKFCTVCGANQLTGKQVNDTENVSDSKLTGMILQLINQMDKKQKVMYLGGAVAVILLALILNLFVLGPKRVSVSQFMEVGVFGYNGYGTLEYTYNESNAMVKEYYDSLNEYSEGCLYSDESSKCTKLYTRINLLENALYSVNCDSNANDGAITNGDSIHFACSVNKEAFEQAGYKVTKLYQDIKVSDLPEPEVIDIFEGLSFEWVWGNNGYYDLVQTHTDDRLAQLYFDVYNIDSDGYADVVLDDYGNIPLIEFGIVALNGQQARMYVGVEPEYIGYYSTNYDENIMKELADVKLNKYIEKCGWNISVNGNYELILSTEFSHFSYGPSANYKIYTDNGTYSKKISLYDIYVKSL